MKLFSHKEQISFIVCRKFDASGDNRIKQIKPVSKRQICRFPSYLQFLDFILQMHQIRNVHST